MRYDLKNNTGRFIPTSIFRNCQDLDGAKAAEFLRECGCENVTHKDVFTHGLAEGTLDGVTYKLSTNGYLYNVGESY